MRGHVKVEKAETHPEWMCQNGEMSWNLKIDKKVAFNVGYGAGKLFRKIQLFEMFWHAEGMKTAYSGEDIWNGEKYMVSPETCYGYSDKSWGKDFTSPWVWLSSNNLTSKITGKKLTDSTCEKKDMLLVNYEAPNGKKLHNRLWNGGNGKGIVKLYRGKKLIDEVICENVGCEYGEYDSVD